MKCGQFTAMQDDVMALIAIYDAAAAGVVCTRLPTAFIVLSRAGFTLKERAFVAFTWVPKVIP